MAKKKIVSKTNGKTSQHMDEANQHIASEYLLLYAAVILVIVVILIFFFVFSKGGTAISSNSCTFYQNLTCDQLVLVSFKNSNFTNLILVMVISGMPQNSSNENFIVNLSGYGLAHSNCETNVVSYGPSRLCIVTISTKSSPRLNTYISGHMLLTYEACSPNCNTYNYSGIFTTHVVAPLSNLTYDISLHSNTIVQLGSDSTYTWLADGSADQISSNVTIFGYPAINATVLFNATNSTGGKFGNSASRYVLTNKNGTATTYLSSYNNGTAYFTAGIGSQYISTKISFVSPVIVSFSIANLTNALSQSVLAIDSINYSYANLPLSFSWIKSSQHSYAFKNQIMINGTVYTINAVSGCGLSATAFSGILNASSSCNATASYTPG